MQSLFGEDSGAASSASGGADAAADGAPSRTAELPSVPFMLDRVMESVTKPLKVRVEQVLLSSPPVLLAFELQSLLKFYRGTVAPILGGESALATALAALDTLSERVCRDQLRAFADRAARKTGSPAGDLLPPPEVQEAVQLVSGVLRVHEASLGAVSLAPPDGEPAAATGDAFLPAVWHSVVDPVVAMCDRLALQIPAADGGAAGPGADGPSTSGTGARAPPINRFQALRQAGMRAQHAAQLSAVHVLGGGESRRLIFLANCLGALHTPLAAKQPLAALAAGLGARLASTTQALVAGEADALLRATGVGAVLAVLRDPQGVPPAELAATRPAVALRGLAAKVGRWPGPSMHRGRGRGCPSSPAPHAPLSLLCPSQCPRCSC